MIRYAFAALALKTFSINTTTKNLYRKIGNVIGGKMRENTDLRVYIDRGNLLTEMYLKHGALQPGDHVLELGTGWMHWFAIYLRLFNDIRLTTLDVWDNRQFDAFQACFSALRQELSGMAAARELLERILTARDFEEVYELLNVENIIVPNGSLASFPDRSYASVFSMHVLEHVHRDLVPQLISDIFRTIRPGHLTIHQIGIDDHLAHYDSSASPKQYLRYSDRTWSKFFENEVQYVNRLQMSDWIQAFEKAGFTLVEKIVEAVNIDDLRVAPDFQHYSGEDLACTILTVVFRRPRDSE